MFLDLVQKETARSQQFPLWSEWGKPGGNEIGVDEMGATGHLR